MQENLWLILVGSILVNNFVMSRFYGTCPFLGVSKQVSTALGMGVAVTFVMGVASLVTYLVQYYILVPLELTYLQTIAFILVIAVLVQLVEMVINKTSPSLYKALGVYLPLITTNCAVLGVTIRRQRRGLGAGLYAGDRAVCGRARAPGEQQYPRVLQGLPLHAHRGGADGGGLPRLPGTDLRGRVT